MHTRPIRIAWDNSLAGRNRTGSGIYARRLLEELSRRCDVQIQVFTGHNLTRDKQGLGTAAARNLVSLYWNNVVFPYQLRTHRFDLVHSPAFVLPLYCPIPSVVTVHDLTFRLFPEHFGRRWRIYMDWVLPLALRSASAVLCGSEHTKADLLKTYKTQPEKVCVTHYGVDHHTFRPGAHFDGSYALNLGLSKPYVLHVGEFSPRKNIPVLLRALAESRSRGRFEGMQLLLVGPSSGGKSVTEIRETVRNLDLQDIVVFAGHVPADVLPGLYANARVVVMPSLYEGFGFPIVEGMASGVPVVTSNSSSMSEIAGDAALLVTPGDQSALAEAIEQVLHDQPLAGELRRRGLARAAQFNWKRTADETVAVYRRVAASC